VAEFIVPTDKGKVRVNLGRVPTNLKERNQLIDDALQSGNYTPVTPSAGEIVLEGGKRAMQTLGPVIAPMAGIARGTVAGAPLGPAGMVGGAVLGGMAGFAANEAVDLGSRMATGQPPKPTSEVVSNVVLGGGRAGLESTPPGAIAGGLARAAQGRMATDVLGGLGQATLGLVGSPQAIQFLASRNVEQASRQAVMNSARAFGIELTAGEQAGTPMLRGIEAITSRSFFGSGSFRDIGLRQTDQAVKAAKGISDATTGPMLDTTTRSNRFLTALSARVDDLKKQAGDKFDQWLSTTGPETPVEIGSLVATAQGLKAQMPSTPSLRNSKLTAVLDDIARLDRPALGPQTDILGQPIKRPVPISELRNIRTALGEIAYPDRLAGAAVSDVPIGQARQLYGAMTQALEETADRAGTLTMLKEANQFYKTSVADALDSNFYKAILASEKQLGSFSKQLFNPRDPGLLMDAKATVSPAGWKMVQQQYFDDVFSEAIKEAPQDIVPMFLGQKFADRIQRDTNVLKVLFDPEQTKALGELAKVVRAAAPTMSVTRIRDFTTGAIGVFVQGGGAGAALSDMASQGVGAANTAMLGATTIMPYVLGKALTDPTTSRIIAAAIREGRLDAQTGETVAKHLLRFTAADANQPATPQRTE